MVSVSNINVNRIPASAPLPRPPGLVVTPRLIGADKGPQAADQQNHWGADCEQGALRDAAGGGVGGARRFRC